MPRLEDCTWPRTQASAHTDEEELACMGIILIYYEAKKIT